MEPVRFDERTWDAFAALGTTRRYRQGTFLFLEGDAPGHVFGVAGGRVKVVAHAERGRDVVLAVRARHELFGELAAIDGLPRSASAVARDDVVVVAVTPAAFNRFVEDHPGVAVQLLRLLAERLRRTTQLHVEQRGADLVRRIARRLAEMIPAGDDGPSVVTLRISHGDLAEWVSANRETTSRALGRLRDLGLIETGRQRIDVVDRDGLRALAGSVGG
jgi:CRP-like cAMP-binding protein